MRHPHTSADTALTPLRPDLARLIARLCESAAQEEPSLSQSEAMALREFGRKALAGGVLVR